MRMASWLSTASTIRPFDFCPEPLLFPFLIVEAKSEKSPDCFTDIEDQTGFAIRALLKLQDDLRSATRVACQSKSEPLVWFLSCRGENWRVAAAHVEQDRKCVPHYVSSSISLPSAKSSQSHSE
jgi:hypothetical protein